MQPLDDALLLDIWARRNARRRDDCDDCADLFASARMPGDAQLDEWPLARCQAALLELRCATFGPTLEAAMDCPQCGARLEFELDADALLKVQRDGSADHAGAPALCVQGLGFRLPTRRDLVAVSGLDDERDAVVALARACCIDDPARVEWTDALLASLDAAFEAADPLGNLELSLACPDCRCVWDQPLDLPGYFREEIDVRARVLLVEVHRLARAYGWSERDILGMAPARRKAYLELLA
ncbi:hypothetical protein AWB74_06122 [Caballeronia arvi]|uniref:Phage baseplate protein n=1 Tax=Caballeronia arvi TaxID=1777135 RepID=A0A158KMK8_9BURK|nr:hypothetical protein [Caballeronia arvi]SAL81989.1 hypothetical protein AWB74_06122 [Caballeronia arvi]